MMILVIGANKWGRASTIQEAMKVGRIKRSEPHIIFGGNAKKAWVDEIGNVNWSEGHMEKIGEFNLPKKSKPNPRRRGRR